MKVYIEVKGKKDKQRVIQVIEIGDEDACDEVRIVHPSGAEDIVEVLEADDESDDAPEGEDDEEGDGDEDRT